MSRTYWTRVWAVFVAVQAAGLMSSLLWPRTPQSFSAYLWGAGLIFSFPGNLVGAAVAEKLLWHSQASSLQIWFASLPILLLVNGLLWFGVFALLRLLFHGATKAGHLRTR